MCPPLKVKMIHIRTAVFVLDPYLLVVQPSHITIYDISAESLLKFPKNL